MEYDYGVWLWSMEYDHGVWLWNIITEYDYGMWSMNVLYTMYYVPCMMYYAACTLYYVQSVIMRYHGVSWDIMGYHRPCTVVGNHSASETRLRCHDRSAPHARGLFHLFFTRLLEGKSKGECRLHDAPKTTLLENDISTSTKLTHGFSGWNSNFWRYNGL